MHAVSQGQTQQRRKTRITGNDSLLRSTGYAGVLGDSYTFCSFAAFGTQLCTFLPEMHTSRADFVLPDTE